MVMAMWSSSRALGGLASTHSKHTDQNLALSMKTNVLVADSHSQNTLHLMSTSPVRGDHLISPTWHGHINLEGLPYVRQSSDSYINLSRSFAAPEGLWQGADSVTQDFNINVWRMKQLGFNAIRLPFRFTDFEVNPIGVKHQCQVAPSVSQLCQQLSWTSTNELCHDVLTHALSMSARNSNLSGIKNLTPSLLGWKRVCHSSIQKIWHLPCAAECQVHNGARQLPQPAAEFSRPAG